MSNYWQIRERDRLFSKEMKMADKELSAQYIRCFNKTKREMVALYNEILASSANGTLLASDLYKYNRYYELLNNLNANLRQLGLTEIQITEKYLTDMYKANYALLDKELGFSNLVDESAVKNCINSVWCKDGKMWSDRIWSNKALLEERIKNGMIDCLASGTTKDELIKSLMSDFNVGFNQASRIARTELNYVQNQSALERYANAGIKRYKILSNQADDESCAPLNGKEYLISEATVGLNMPPFHGNCRCSILGVI